MHATTATRDTKSAIMDVAEALMAEHGIGGVSLRAIMAEAGVNSAALHYHFGSRDGLIAAILGRGGKGINLRRRELLEEIESRGAPPCVDDVIDVIVDPMTEFLRAEGEAGRRFFRFVARLQSDRTNIHQDLEQHYYPENWTGLRQLIRRVRGDLPRKEVKWRITMIVDTMLQSLSNAAVMAQQWNSRNHAAELDDFVLSLKSFLSGGLAAPARTARAGRSQRGRANQLQAAKNR